MTQTRSSIVAPGQPGYYHCVTRCVRRAWPCGFDRCSGKDYEHPKLMVVARIALFSITLMSYTVMSNHLHLVLSVEPETAGNWSDEDVAERWLRLLPSREPERVEQRRAALLANSDGLAGLAPRAACRPEPVHALPRRVRGPAVRKQREEIGQPGLLPPAIRHDSA